MVFPLDLKNVEEVGPRGVYFNEILVWFRNRVREGRDLEVLRALEGVNITISKEDGTRQTLAFTYFVIWIPFILANVKSTRSDKEDGSGG